MSADNFVLIKEIKPKRYSVSLKSIEISAGYNRRYFTDLEEAIRYANSLVEEYQVEYGIVIDLLDKETNNG